MALTKEKVLPQGIYMWNISLTIQKLWSMLNTDTEKKVLPQKNTYVKYERSITYHSKVMLKFFADKRTNRVTDKQGNGQADRTKTKWPRSIGGKIKAAIEHLRW